MDWPGAITVSVAFLSLAWVVSSLVRAWREVMVARASSGIGSDDWVSPVISGKAINCDGEAADEEEGG